VINVRTIIILLISLLLVACAGNDTRYQDNANLERPPEIPIDKQAAEQIAANEIEKPIRRHGKGLKSDVYVLEGPPLEMRLKRGFDESWSLINRAIQLNELKVPDQDRSKGLLSVEFNGAGLFNNVFSLLESGDKAVYELKVEPQDEETRVTINMMGSKEDSDSGSPKDGFAEPPIESKASKLLNLLYDTLHDKLKED
jgi:NlpB/DapX lipoprotein